jgi:Flp pilus assembly pilin Flp
MLNKLWNDETGAIVSAEIVLVATILVIGMIVGLKSVRDGVVTELADVGQAFSNFDQSYSYSSVDGHIAGTAGGAFVDAPDFCDADDEVNPDGASRCVDPSPAGAAETTGGSGPLGN